MDSTVYINAQYNVMFFIQYYMHCTLTVTTDKSSVQKHNTNVQCIRNFDKDQEQSLSYENEVLNKLIKENKRKLARTFNVSMVTMMTLSLSIIKDLRSSPPTFTPKNSQFLKPQILHRFSVASYLDNIPSAPASAYSVYASQLIRCACCCSNYSDFLSRHRALVIRLLSQGYRVNHLSNTFKKFYGRHNDLVGQYKKNVCQMFADSISKNDFHFYGFADGRNDKIS